MAPRPHLHGFDRVGMGTGEDRGPQAMTLRPVHIRQDPGRHRVLPEQPRLPAEAAVAAKLQVLNVKRHSLSLAVIFYKNNVTCPGWCGSVD